MKTIEGIRPSAQIINREAQIMKLVNSPYITPLLDHFYDSYLGAYVLIMPCCPSNLRTLIDQRKPLS